MDTGLMGVSAKGRYGVAGDRGSLRAASVQVGTLQQALETVDRTHARLCDVADMAERIADIVDGSPPPSEAGSKGMPLMDGMIDTLNERAEALSGPVVRIGEALARIERRFG